VNPLSRQKSGTPCARVSVLLFLLRATGMTAHIIISVLGLVTLVVYTIATKKEWKFPALEVLMRVFYGIALITGIVMMKVHGIAALGIVHKAGAALFALLLVVLLVHKLIIKKAK
jgi:hypothetical protein